MSKRKSALIVGVVLILCTTVALGAAPPNSRILFASGPSVPQSVKEFAWDVIVSRCNYQGHELDQRTFWAYDVRVRRAGTDVMYVIQLVSDLTWQKAEPPAFIEMAVLDDGRLRLTALSSTYVSCA